MYACKFFADRRPSHHTRFETTCRLFYSLVDVCIILDPLLVAILTIVLPCKIPFVGGMLLCGRPKTIATTAMTLFLALMEFVVMLTMFLGTFQYTGYTLLTGIFILYTECGSFLARKFDNFELSFLKYMELQVLEKLVNGAIRGRILLVVFLMMPVLQILSCFGFLMLLKGSVLNSTIFFALYFDCVCFTLLILNSSAKLFINTRAWMSHLTPTKDKTNRRIMRSLTPLKIQFGNNFVDALTPLVFQQFCATQTASLLVLKYKL